MAISVETILKHRGPCLTTTLVEELVDVGGLTPQAARQRASRGTAGMVRLIELPFPRRVRFVCLTSQQKTPKYWKALRDRTTRA